MNRLQGCDDDDIEMKTNYFLLNEYKINKIWHNDVNVERYGFFSFCTSCLASPCLVATLCPFEPMSSMRIYVSIKIWDDEENYEFLYENFILYRKP